MPSTPRTERFLSVLQTHKGIIYPIARAYCPQPEDRQDLVQDIVLQLWKALDTYSDQYQYSTWIYPHCLECGHFLLPERKTTSIPESTPF